MPACFFTVLSVLTRQYIQSALFASDVQILDPSIVYVPLDKTAEVKIFAKSDPAPGSENPWHHQISPLEIFGKNSCFCSSVPNSKSTGPNIEIPKLI